MAGKIVFADGQTFPGAGDVHSVNEIGPNSSGNITLTANNVNALALSGGLMTGDITFNDGQQFAGVLELTGGVMTGDITFNSGQQFPGTVTTVNGFTGTVTLDAADVGALPVANPAFTGALTGPAVTTNR